MSQDRAVADRLGMDRTTLTRNLGPLLAQGLVMIGHGDDRRVRTITMTAKGHRAAVAALPHWHRPTMMHTKTLVVDGILSIFGSANFDNRSLELNDELNVAAWNRELGARFIADFEQDLRSATRLDLTRWRQRSLLQKSREQFWSCFGDVF